MMKQRNTLDVAQYLGPETGYTGSVDLSLHVSMMTQTTFGYVSVGTRPVEPLPPLRGVLLQLINPPLSVGEVARKAEDCAEQFMADCGRMSIHEVRLWRQRLTQLRRQLEDVLMETEEFCVWDAMPYSLVPSTLDLASCLERPFRATCHFDEDRQTREVSISISLAGDDPKTRDLVVSLVERTLGFDFSEVSVEAFGRSGHLCRKPLAWPALDERITFSIDQERQTPSVCVVATARESLLFSAEFDLAW